MIRIMSGHQTSLESFPTEVFSLTSEYLLFGDILALYQCGSSIVCSKLLQSRLEVIDMTSAVLDPFPGWSTASPAKFYHRRPHQLPSLLKLIKFIRVLKFSGSSASYDLTNVEVLLPWATTLTRVDLVVQDGTSFLQQGEPRKPTGPIISDGPSVEDHFRDFQLYPSQLVPLSSDSSLNDTYAELTSETSSRGAAHFAFSGSTTETPKLSWAPLKDLFPVLNSFSLVSEDLIKIYGQQYQDFFQVLPPNLTVLKLRPLAEEIQKEHLIHLPKSLTEYELLRTEKNEHLYPQMLDALPPSVVRLSISSIHPNLLPSFSHLKTLELCNCLDFGFDLPHSLESLIIHRTRTSFFGGPAHSTSISSWPPTLTVFSLPPDSKPLSASLFTHVPPHLKVLHCNSILPTAILGIQEVLLKLPTSLTDLRVRTIVWPSLSKTVHPLRKFFSGHLLANLRILNIPIVALIKTSLQEDLPSIHSLCLPNGIISESALLKLPSQLKSFEIGTVDAEGRFLNKSTVVPGFLSLIDLEKSLTAFPATWKVRQKLNRAYDSDACLLDGTRLADIHWSSRFTFKSVICTKLMYCPSQIQQITGTWKLDIPPERLPGTLKVIAGPYSFHWTDTPKLPLGISILGKAHVELGDDQVQLAIKAGYLPPPLYCHPPIIPESFLGQVHYSAQLIHYSCPLTDTILVNLNPSTVHMTNLSLEFGKVTEKGIKHIPASIKKLEIMSVDHDDLLEAVYLRLANFDNLTSLTIPAHSHLQNSGFDLIPPSITSLTIIQNPSHNSIEIHGEHFQYLRPALTTLSILAPCHFKDEHAKFIMASVTSLHINSDCLTEALLPILPVSVKSLALSPTPNSLSICEKFKASRKSLLDTRTGGSSNSWFQGPNRNK